MTRSDGLQNDSFGLAVPFMIYSPVQGPASGGNFQRGWKLFSILSCVEGKETWLLVYHVVHGIWPDFVNDVLGAIFFGVDRHRSIDPMRRK